MATYGWGACPRCRKPHSSLKMRGICEPCQAKAIEREMVDFIATPEKLRQHPCLVEIEDHMDEHYSVP